MFNLSLMHQGNKYIFDTNDTSPTQTTQPLYFAFLRKR